MAVLAKLKGIFFGRYLWVTNTVSGGLFLAIGDGIQQNFERSQTHGSRRKAHDWHRTGDNPWHLKRKQ